MPALAQERREGKENERSMMPDLRVRTLHKWLPDHCLCNTIVWMTPRVHPTANLIKQLQFTWEAIKYREGGATDWLWVTGPNLRECFLDDDHQRPVLVPVHTTGCIVHDWWPNSFRCRRDSISGEFKDYWGYDTGDDRRCV